jgi:hypothetical protein
MRAPNEKYPNLLLFFLLISLCTLPAMADDKEYPPTPPPKETRPITTDVKTLIDKPPAHPTLKADPEQSVSPGTINTKPPTNPPQAGNEENQNLFIKRNLPPAGSRIITQRPSEITNASDATIHNSCKVILMSAEDAISEHFIQQGCCGGVTGGCGMTRIHRDGRAELIESGPRKKKELINDPVLADRIFKIAGTNGFFEVRQTEVGNLTCFIDYCSPDREHHASWVIDNYSLSKAILELLEEIRKFRKDTLH